MTDPRWLTAEQLSAWKKLIAVVELLPGTLESQLQRDSGISHGFSTDSVTDVQRVDYLIRGVSVPAGAHRVEFRYQPSSWRAGWIVSAVALLVILAAAALGWRRRQHSASGHA